MTTDTGPRLTVLRHGPTDWNEAGRLQGLADRPLSPDGVLRVRTWRLPPDIATAKAYVSPLSRARQTAEILELDPTVEPRLIEADWGAWEGRRLADLRRDLGPAMAENEARGLDFRPPGGDAPRDTVDRLRPFIADLWGRGEDAVAITHRGVIRALLVLATGWTMLGKPPVKVGRDAAVRFRLTGPDGVALEGPVDLCP